MEQVRTRDFIYTSDDLYFASTNYIHPENRVISFLRYVPDPEGDREKDGKRYRKVGSEEAYSYLRENYPDYLYFSEVTNVEMMGVPLDKVERIIKPENRLLGLKKTFDEGGEVKNPELIAKLMDVADFFHFMADIPYDHLGISGSILPGLQKAMSATWTLLYMVLTTTEEQLPLLKSTVEKKSTSKKWTSTLPLKESPTITGILSMTKECLTKALQKRNSDGMKTEKQTEEQ